MSQRGGRAAGRGACAAVADNEEFPEWFRQFLATRGNVQSPTDIPTTATSEGEGIVPYALALPAPPALDLLKLCQEFHSLGKRPYQGIETFSETRAWVRICERAFADKEIDPILMGRIASRHLIGDALAWWDIIVKEVYVGVMT